MAIIAVLGHGVVGSGVMEVLYANTDSIAQRAKEKIEVKYVLDIKNFPETEYHDKFIKDFETIISDESIQVIVEVIGGLHPAYDFVKRCLEAGKNVVTSNKELVAAKGAELLAIAQKNNLNFLFEASVGGGIPIIRPISQCLAANEVSEIAGILNGTTNFILTKMIREKMEFDDALRIAQDLGYAERDPSADIEGGDACRKICILASLTYGTHVYPEEVYTRGITEISLSDIEYAKAWGGVVKLIGEVRKLESGKLHVIVSPMFVASESQLSNVDDVFNGIMVRGDATGDVVFYGKGAGKLPTASAVVADVIDCIRHFKARKYLFWEDGKSGYVEDYRNYIENIFVRISHGEESDAISLAERIFGAFTRIVSKATIKGEIAFIVNGIRLGDLENKIREMEAYGACVLSTILVSDF